MGLFSKGVDIIVSGGVSKGYRIPWVDPNVGVIVMQNYGNGTSFGHIQLLVNNGSIKTETADGFEIHTLDGNYENTYTPLLSNIVAKAQPNKQLII